MSDKELTDHPKHYGGEGNPYEAINIIEAMGWGEGFCMGSAVKYLLRNGHKDGEPAERDLGKSKWFIDRRVYEIENGMDGRMDVEEAKRMAMRIMGNDGVSDDILNAMFPRRKDTDTATIGIKGFGASSPHESEDDYAWETVFDHCDRHPTIEPIRSVEDTDCPEAINHVIQVDGDRLLVQRGEPMGFGDVIRMMKADDTLKFARRGWNGRGIYIQLQNPDEGSANTLPYIYIVTNALMSSNPDAPRGRVPWLASQTDMLAEDWINIDIVETAFNSQVTSPPSDGTQTIYS